MRRSWEKLLAGGCALALLFGSITACSADRDTQLPTEPEEDISSVKKEPATEAPLPEEEPKSLYIGAAEELDAEQRRLYENTVVALLQEDLWTARDRYDAAHYLMIPMYYAFWAGEDAWIDCFGTFFSRFCEDVCGGGDQYNFAQDSFLNRLQFLYFSTQFMNLCAANDRKDLIPQGLPEYVLSCGEEYLSEYNKNLKKTYLENMQFVLDGGTYKYSWYAAITDIDWFALAVLCDLYVLYNGMGWEVTETMSMAATLAYDIFSDPDLNRETPDGGWIFQPGIWSEHGSYVYAGNAEITEDIEPSIVPDLAWDTSHFHRMPVCLRSYQAAQDNAERKAVFVERRTQLANQMILHVLKKVDGNWLTTTFVDGRNGVYRYGYKGDGQGYAGYDVSGTFLLGWWSLLGDGRITECYTDILQMFPMPGDRSNPYFDHLTTRDQNPLFDMDTAYDLGMFQCMVTCAALLRQE